MGWKLRDFRCSACQATFEDLVKNNDCSEVICPECQSSDVEAVISAVSLGWSNNVETRAEMLKRRSEEHTRREQKRGNMLSPRDLTGK